LLQKSFAHNDAFSRSRQGKTEVLAIFRFILHSSY
jgi:hypothetical protein